MGRTYRGLRRKFGSKKTQNHRKRSKWNARNGTRLRTLATDLAEFQEIVGIEAESLHRPPDLSEKKRKSAERITKILISEKTPTAPAPVVVSAPPLKTPKSLRRDLRVFLDSLTTETLRARKAYAAQQVAHLQRLVSQMRQEYLPVDSSFAPAISRFLERKRYWDTQTGLIGPLLVERESS